MNKDKPILSVYSRPGCHLCEDMVDALISWQERYNFDISIVDIDEDPGLIRRYAGRIPVLASNEVEICQYHIDEAALLAFFQRSE